MHPFTVMREFTEGMDRLFAATRGEYTAWYPEIEIKRRNGVFRLVTKLPDARRETIRVFVEGSFLVLEGSRSVGSRDGDSPCTFREEIVLPEGLHPSDVTARFIEGMLVVEFPYKDLPQREVQVLSEAVVGQ